MKRTHESSNRRKSSRSSASARLAIWSWRTWLLVAALVGGTIVWGYLATERARSREPAPLLANGLRVSGRGRHDASHVLDPARFADERVRQAYAIARAIPQTLNQLYCWCRCEENLGMRSLLECYETEHAARCNICLSEAELAWRLTQLGTTGPAQIQAAIDAWAGQT